MNLKKCYKKYPIGTAIFFVKSVYPKYENNIRKIYEIEYDDIQSGIVIGASHIYLGKYNEGFSKYSYAGEEEYQPSYLDVNSSELILLVKLQYRGSKFIKVRPIDIIDYIDNEKFLKIQQKLFPLQKAYQWTEENKKEWKEWVKDFPRDSKGRFCK